MPTLNKHQSKNSTKALILGDSGEGKTGALASLANGGYRLVIADFDNGLDILHQYVKPECMKNINYITFTDVMKKTGKKLTFEANPTAWTSFLSACESWEDLGGVESWDEKTVFVIDSLTHLGQAALRFAWSIGKKTSANPSQPDWGTAMGQVENLLAKLYHTSVKCNVLVLSHVAYVTSENGGIMKGMPEVIGNKLTPKIPTYFNNTFYLKSAPSVNGATHWIHTIAKDRVAVKNTRPLILPPKLPVESGLFTIFQTLQKGNSLSSL